MPFLHLPVQSGSNKILKLMNRNHSVENYLETFNKLKEINSKIEFSSDFIIAYPGEKKSGPCMWVELRDGTRVNLPVIIINGKHDGPKVVITAAQHPTELVGVTATQIVANRLDPEQLKGSLIIFPVANPLAMQFAQY